MSQQAGTDIGAAAMPALAVTAGVTVVLKALTGIALLPLGVLAIVVFVVALALVLRIKRMSGTPSA